MTNAELIAKIKAEIERKRSYNQRNASPEGAGAFYEDERILSFLDTLESEKPAPADLEEAAEGKFPVYWKDYPKDGIVRSESSYDTNKQCRDAFIAGAKWQKEQMMKEAVELELKDNVNYPSDWNQVGMVALYFYTSPTFKFGDKVRIIIVKED